MHTNVRWHTVADSLFRIGGDLPKYWIIGSPKNRNILTMAQNSVLIFISHYENLWMRCCAHLFTSDHVSIFQPLFWHISTDREGKVRSKLRFNFHLLATWIGLLLSASRMITGSQFSLCSTSLSSLQAVFARTARVELANDSERQETCKGKQESHWRPCHYLICWARNNRRGWYTQCVCKCANRQPQLSLAHVGLAGDFWINYGRSAVSLLLVSRMHLQCSKTTTSLIVLVFCFSHLLNYCVVVRAKSKSLDGVL